MRKLLVPLALFAALAGCEGRDMTPPGGRAQDIMPPAPERAQEQQQELAPAAGEAQRREASFDLKPARGVDIDAEAEFVDTGRGVRIVLTVEDGAPGKHGVHVHEKGDCSDISGKSMGDHFAPDGHEHALPPQEPRHLGDLGNIEIGEDGKGRLEITVTRANLRPNDRLSFVGRALVVHEGEDTGRGPAGESGKPIACGVIEVD
jgi:Cu-Zn family superoxide dismutase